MTDQPSLRPADCADPGRLMFLQYVGQYFAAEPRLNRLADGTACTTCGHTSARLWLTASGKASCLAQQTITRKRAARKSANEPMLPPANTAGSTSMGDGNMVVAGPHRALLITKLLPDKPIPAKLDIVFSDKGSIRSAKLDLLRHPPQPPFVAIVFGQKAHFPTEITIDESRIFVNGPVSQALDRPYLSRLLDIATRVGGTTILDLIALRHRIAGGDTDADAPKRHKQDQQALFDLRSAGLITPAEFRLLPSPGTPEAAFLRQASE
jgi:hypothetical protein